MSISCYNNNLKLWDISNCECLLNLENINTEGFLFSACFLNDNNQNFIITSNGNYKENYELIKVFDFNGTKFKEIEGSNEQTYFIDRYYDNKLFKIFIITGNEGYVKSYDYINNKVYNKYCDNDNTRHFSIIIKEEKEIIKLIESSGDGNIRIWNFHSGEILKKIRVCDDYLNDICLWNNNFLFVGCNDKTIKLINLENGVIFRNLNGYNDIVLTIKKFFHPLYGECLLSQGYGNEQIKLYIIKN